MIKNLGTKTLVDHIKDSEFEFWIAKDYTRKDKKEYEWEFFTENTPEVANFLEEIGMVDLDKTERWPAGIVREMGLKPVKVTLVRDANLHNHIGEMLDDLLVLLNDNKAATKLVWIEAYNLVLFGQNY
jgi:hypothetical protein